MIRRCSRGEKWLQGERGLRARNSKLRTVAADLFLKRGYDGVTIDKVFELAGGSKSTVYSEFGGKLRFIHQQHRDAFAENRNEGWRRSTIRGLDLEQSLKTLAFHILKLISAKRSWISIGCHWRSSDCP